ncbi:MAG: PIN domain-containing protein [Nevskia sp.]|nr:PIN domain-containing protein [Nevskia sp.]
MAGLTLDSGAFIAFEKGQRKFLALLKGAANRGDTLTVPAVVLAEVWRGGPRSALISKLLQWCNVESTDETLARSAGVAVGAVAGASPIDAIVVASAATRGDRVVTSDPNDVHKLLHHFPAVPGLVSV